MNNNTIEVINNEDHEKCAKCGGSCCKQYAGTYAPWDFDHEITMEFLDDILNDRIEGIPPVSIDWCESYKEDWRNGFFIRPRHVGGDIVDPSWANVPCIHLTENGCKLPFEKRPYGCRSLDPAHCKDMGDDGCIDKEKSADMWDEYHDILFELYFKYDKGTYTGKRSLLDHYLGDWF